MSAQFPLIEQEMMFPYYSGDPVTSVGETKVTYATARSILNPATGFIGKRSDDEPGFDFTLNPYVGCWHGCKYCYAKAFANSQYKQDNWGYWLEVKENAVYKARQHSKLDGKRVYMSSVTDPYQPIENKLGVVRSVLEVFADRGDRVLLVVQTRNPLATRDLDVMQRIIDNGGRVQVNMTVTTDDDEVRRLVEPRCPSIPARLKAIKEVAATEVDAAITMSPLLYVSNHERFAGSLLDTGVTAFIAQSLHPMARNNEGTFKASTWNEAISPMAQVLDCTPQQAMSVHRKRYDRDIAELRNLLPDITEGREGFRPPF